MHNIPDGQGQNGPYGAMIERLGPHGPQQSGNMVKGPLVSTPQKAILDLIVEQVKGADKGEVVGRASLNWLHELGDSMAQLRHVRSRVG
jgi:hypothetical protein